MQTIVSTAEMSDEEYLEHLARFHPRNPDMPRAVHSGLHAKHDFSHEHSSQARRNNPAVYNTRTDT